MCIRDSLCAAAFVLQQKYLPTLGQVVSNSVALCTEAGPQGLTASGCLMTTLLATGTSSFLKEDLDSTSASTADISQRKERILHMERGKQGIQKNLQILCVDPLPVVSNHGATGPCPAFPPGKTAPGPKVGTTRTLQDLAKSNDQIMHMWVQFMESTQKR